MPQLLHRAGGAVLDVDRSFADGGQPARYALIGGERVLVSAGSPPHPEIFQKGSAFFYGDGKPVIKAEDVEWLAEPFRTAALAQVKQAESGQPVTFRGKSNPRRLRMPRSGRPRRVKFNADQALTEVGVS